MSFCLSFHLASLDATEPHQPDGAADLSCEDGTRQHATDGCPLSCKQQVGGSSPPPAPRTAGHRPAHLPMGSPCSVLGGWPLGVYW